MQRFQTREVTIGNVKIGKNNPIAIQSMVTTDTLDVISTVDQIKLLQDVGCEIVRLAVIGEKHAYACEDIKDNLVKSGYYIPLVADVHFLPSVANIVIDFVDKVRINPGNFTNTKEDIEKYFLPLIKKCKDLKKALRIGVNHGSLSKRILDLYGNTPLGMVFSAFEFTKICRDNDFHDIVYSMKASNPIITVQAYRLLVEKMKENEYDYPLHLGVTEAGNLDDGVIKSSVGVGGLLLEGIGDTIRVSLTEKPQEEIAIAEGLRSLFNQYERFNERNIDMSFANKDSLAFFNKPMGDGFIVNDKLHYKNEIKEFVILDEKSHFKKSEYIFFRPSDNRVYYTKRMKRYLVENNIDAKLIANFTYTKEDIAIRAASELGILFLDNIIDGVYLETNLTDDENYKLTMKILQACRKKCVETEFISCPGCGRTLFDINKITKKIKAKTSHLPGVKIAIMGCIVNGVGEMADADFGFIGASKDKVNLYVGQKCIKRDIDFLKAEDELIEVIKKEGKWQEP